MFVREKQFIGTFDIRYKNGWFFHKTFGKRA